MHAEALNAAIDAWIAELQNEDCHDIDVEGRRALHSGIVLDIVADDNPWEAREQQVIALPPLDGKNRLVFHGVDKDAERGLHIAYVDRQTLQGEHVDVPDQHRIHLWIGRAADDDAFAAVRARFEETAIEGVWDHLLSAERLLATLDPARPVPRRVIEAIGRLNRRMA